MSSLSARGVGSEETQSEGGIRGTPKESEFIGTRGIPPLPTPEEWQERSQRILQLLDEWLLEEPGEDLATWEELERGLKEHPVRFRSVSFDE